MQTTDQETMQAVMYRQYGGPEVLETARLPIPPAGAGQVLVRVAAVGLNPKDVVIRGGDLKLLTGRRFPKATGFDFSGVVVRTGSGVTSIRPGDEVFGYLEDLHGGAAAEYLAVRQEWVAPKPAAVGHAAMAAVPCAYLTAWQALVQQAGLERGQRVLIYGASGGVGTAAIQVARHRGATVTAVSSGRNTAYCLAQGAHAALAYDQGDLARTLTEKYDVFFQVHVLSGSRYGLAKEVLTPGGTFLTLNPSPGSMLRDVASRVLPGPRHRTVLVKSRREDLAQLAGLIERGELRPPVGQTLPLDCIREAHAQLQTGHTVGKLVLTVPGGPGDGKSATQELRQSDYKTW